MQTERSPYPAKLAYLHLLTLSAFAITHPVLEVLRAGPEFFVVHGARAKDIVFLLAFLLVSIPLLLVAVEMALGAVSQRLRRPVHVLFVLLLLSAILLPPLAKFIKPGWAACAATLLLGGAGAFLIQRSRGARSFVSFLSLILLISPAIFLSSSGIRTILFPENADIERVDVASDTPVVVVVFDEFSLHSLLDENLKLDSRRFPNFAALAGQSTWFRNTTSVNQFTPIAVPAIVAGKFPNPDRLLPTIDNYPGNLFTLLRHSYDMKISEPISKLCPPEVCEANKPPVRFRQRALALMLDTAAIYLNLLVPRDIDLGLPDITGQWRDFWQDRKGWKKANFSRPARVDKFHRYLERMAIGAKPPLFFLHLLLPHMPYQFLPSGKTYPTGGPRHGYVNNEWEDDAVAIQKNFQRYLWQVAASDRLLGKLMARLKALGVYDRALIVVTADHGISFQPGTYRRGNPHHPAFFQDIMLVPLFIKRPFQKEPEENGMNVETIDILPSIADVLGIKIPWKIDGHSVFDSTGPRREQKRVMLGALPYEAKAPHQPDRPGDILTFPVPASFPRETLNWKVKLPGLDAPNAFDLFYIGPRAGLIGRPLDTFQIERKPGAVSVALEGDLALAGEEAYVKVNPGSWYIPARLMGTLSIPAPAPRAELALALNGVVQGFSYPFLPVAAVRRDFEFLIKEDSFLIGKNKIELFLVEDGTAQPVLRKLPITAKR